MAKAFKRGDHVEWNSEAGRVSGVIVKEVTFSSCGLNPIPVYESTVYRDLAS
jgi:hypothetical protein